MDLTLRLPLYILTEDYIANVSVELCHSMRLIPDFFMMAILITLPLITAERLFKLITNPRWPRKRNRLIIAILLGVAYLLAFIISMLPLTAVFGRGDKLNTRCSDTLKYGYVSFAFTYSALTALSIILTFIFSITTVFVLKARLAYQKSKSKRRVLKRGVVSAISLTALLGIATIPFAISLQIVLTCGGNMLHNDNFCNGIMPHIFRMAVVVNKISFTLLPIVLLRLNPSMRRRIWLSFRKPKQAAGIVTLSSTNTHSITEKNSDQEQEPMTDAEGNFIITLNEERQFPDEVIRRMQLHGKHRQNFMEIVDVLSVISEASETNGSGMQRSNSSGDLSDFHSSDSSNGGHMISGGSMTLPRSSSVKRSYSNASYISEDKET